MKKTTITCDCGCGSSITLSELEDWKLGWLVLSQTNVNPASDYIKLNRELQFASLDCLARWASKAVPEGKALIKSAESGPQPRGSYISRQVEEIFV